MNSVVNQTYSNVEVIVVDDGSVDESKSVVQSVLEEESATGSLIRQENAGASAARNRGIWEAGGDYYLFLDADDVLVPNAVEQHLQTMRRQDADATVADWINVYQESGEEQRESAAFRFPEDPLASLIYKPMHTSAAMIRRNERQWDESMVVNEVFDYFLGAMAEDGMSIAHTGSTGSRVRHEHSEARITALHDHWEPVARIELLAGYKETLRELAMLNPRREAVLDQKQLSRLYSAMRRYEGATEAGAQVDINRRRLPSYYWFESVGLAGAAYVLGVDRGARLFYEINRWLGRV